MATPLDRRREILRVGLAVTWALVLAVWSGWQELWFYAWHPLDSLTAASAILRSLRPIAWTNLLHALAVGVACLLVSYLWWPRGGTRRADRTTVARTLGTTCIAVCGYVVHYRILPIMPTVGSGVDRASRSVRHLIEGDLWEELAGIGGRILELQWFIAALLAGVVALQAWNLVGRLGGSRRSLAVTVLIVLVPAALLIGTGAIAYLPLPVPRPVLDLDLDAAPHLRGLLLDDPACRKESEAFVDLYFTTHDGADEEIPFHNHGRSEERSEAACEECVLPAARIWTLRGLPIALADGLPRASGPGLVLEVPRSAETARVSRPDSADDPQSVPMHALASALGGQDWIVLKIDAEVEFRRVTSLFQALLVEGVRRADLALMPLGWGQLPDEPVRWVDAKDDDPVFEPSAAPGRRTIVVKRYVGPDGPPGCWSIGGGQDAWLFHYALPEPGTVPSRVRLEMFPGTPYSTFVVHLQAAMAGGAREVSWTVESETDPRTGSVRWE